MKSVDTSTFEGAFQSKMGRLCGEQQHRGASEAVLGSWSVFYLGCIARV
jgi:hypothetical protein